MASAYTVQWGNPGDSPRDRQDRESASRIMDDVLGYQDTVWTEREDAQYTAEILNQHLESAGVRGLFIVRGLD